jgi:hypothetical protein
MSKTCFTHQKKAMEILLTYNCQREISSFSATIGSTRYTQNKNLREVSLPLASLPLEDAPVILALNFPDGTSTAFMSSLTELGRTQDAPVIAGTTGNLFIVPTLSLRDWVFALFALTFLLLLLYAGELAYKRQLMFHRYELLSFTLFLGILIISFNFGFIRV